MVNTGSDVVPAATVVLPTLGRSSLKKAITTLKAQDPAPLIIVKMGEEDTLIKIKKGVNEAKTEFVAVADDDAEYPKEWLANLLEVTGPKVGFVGGPCLPLLDDSSSDAERCIAEVTASFFGTSNMSYRAKVKGRVRDADETNLIGNGLYRRKVFAKILNGEFDKIPPAAWETYVFTRIRQMGFRTLFNPAGVFHHKQRASIFSFTKQIGRSGMGRMNFFKQFPSQIVTKFWMLFPMLFLVYLIAFFGLAFFNLPITNLPLIGYVAILVIVSYGLNHHKSKALPLYYFVMHMSYGAGMLYGLFRNERTWR